MTNLRARPPADPEEGGRADDGQGGACFLSGPSPPGSHRTATSARSWRLVVWQKLAICEQIPSDPTCACRRLPQGRPCAEYGAPLDRSSAERSYPQGKSFGWVDESVTGSATSLDRSGSAQRSPLTTN